MEKIINRQRQQVFAEEFYKKGGEHLFLDEVHKYDTWSKEIKELYDLFIEPTLN